MGMIDEIHLKTLLEDREEVMSDGSA